MHIILHYITFCLHYHHDNDLKRAHKIYIISIIFPKCFEVLLLLLPFSGIETEVQQEEVIRSPLHCYF